MNKSRPYDVTMTKRAVLDQKAWLVWGVGLSVYLVNVMHRSSMAVAGLVARERFDITAGQLAVFVTLQLALIGFSQVPVGVLLDRFGTRRLLTAGLIVMTLAQLGFAFSENYFQALFLRAILGAGDALIFVSVIRLVTNWFQPGAIPVMSQLTGTTGQLGAIIAAFPMTWAFSNIGWTATYFSLAMTNIVIMVLLLMVVRDTPTNKHSTGSPLSFGVARKNVLLAWEHPGTRLGFWTHITTQFASNAFALLWGFPFLVKAEQLSEQQAALVLSVLIVAGMTAGPFLGIASSRFAYYRSSLVLGVISAVVIVWTTVLVWPGESPIWLLVVLVIVLGVAGPTGIIGLDYGRTFNPDYRLGTALGVINQGGFLGSLVAILAIGLIVDWRTNGGEYTPESFVWAMSFQYLIWFVGVVQIWRYRGKSRTRYALDGDGKDGPS